MDIEHIVSELKSERDRLTQAIAALEGHTPRSANRRRHGTPGKMSAATRKRMSDAMKARWKSGAMGKRKKTTATA
jgi:hypothetical protein